jgi:hypothetical protein
VPVRVTLKGVLGPGLNAVSDPAWVDVEGPSSQVARIEAVGTEEIDASRLSRGKEYRKNLLAPVKRVTILRDEPVTVKVAPHRLTR